MNRTSTQEADVHFDPSKPTALLYRQTPNLEYKLEGAMYTASPQATESELDERIPLSVARWHRHVNLCLAPDDQVKDYKTDHPKFGMFGSINTKEPCEAERGRFQPFFLTWMVHIIAKRNVLREQLSRKKPCLRRSPSGPTHETKTQEKHT